MSSLALIRPAAPLPLDPASEWMTDAERSPPHLDADDTLMAAVEIFENNIDLRLIPVVDAQERPIGAIFERDVRRLLLNPYGHALLRNPSYGSSLTPHLRPCPVAELTHDVGALLDAYRSANGTEGMIVTRGGRLFAVLSARKLVHLAADREVQLARGRLERAQRIERASERFEAQVAAVVRTMGDLAASLDANACATVDRAVDLGERATAVASAASQTSHNMGEVADRGRRLVGALGKIGRGTADAKRAAAQAAERVETGGARARELLRSAQSIDSVIALISEIARQVNLLALNATIEAARAGEAGRGFTVVANEVKQLSTQTGTAAARITAHVREICQGIDEVASQQQHVERAIAVMTTLAGDIEAAVEEQQRATRTVARNVDEAFDAATGIQQEVEAIGGTSLAASESAAQMRCLAHRLNEGAGALFGQVEAFLAEMRTA